MDYALIFRLTREAVRNKSFELRQPKPGLRHNSEPMIVSHRFPIRDGLTLAQLPNPLMRLVELKDSTE